MRQLSEYPQIHSRSYVPLNLVMVIDIFHFSQKKLIMYLATDWLLHI